MIFSLNSGTFHNIGSTFTIFSTSVWCVFFQSLSLHRNVLTQAPSVKEEGGQLFWLEGGPLNEF